MKHVSQAYSGSRKDQARSPGLLRIKAMRTLVSHLHKKAGPSETMRRMTLRAFFREHQGQPFHHRPECQVCEVAYSEPLHPLSAASRHGLCLPHVPTFLGSLDACGHACEDSHKAVRTWVLPPRFPRMELLGPKTQRVTSRGRTN